jgi:hypothetical protein
MQFLFKKRNLNFSPTNSFDENIAVVTQIIESRSSKEQTKSNHEKSTYDIYFYIKKLTEYDIVNINAEVSVISKDGFGSEKSLDAKKIEGYTTILSTLNVLNTSTNEFAINAVDVNEKNGKLIHINKIPEKIFIKVTYDVLVNDKLYPRELKYLINYEQVNIKKFNDFEYRSVNSKIIDSKENCLEIKFAKTSIEEKEDIPALDEFKFLKLTEIEENLPNDVKVKNIRINVVGEIGEKSMISSKYFKNYINLFTYDGTLMFYSNNKSISNSRSVTVDKNYQINKIYFQIFAELNNGDTLNYNYYILSEEL